MTDTIRVYDEAIPDGWCENIIDLFESKSDEHHTLTNRNNCPKFTEMCVNRASIQHVSGLVQFVLKVYDKYKDDIGSRFIPPFNQLEEFRVKMEIPKDKTFVMPAGDTRETLVEMYPKVFEMVAEHGYNMTGRDHIIAYNTERGV